MGSLDVVSLFSNIPLHEAVDICVNQPFKNADTVEGFTKWKLKQLLWLATKESYFIINGLPYKETDSLAIGLPLAPSLASTFFHAMKKTG